MRKLLIIGLSWILLLPAVSAQNHISSHGDTWAGKEGRVKAMINMCTDKNQYTGDAVVTLTITNNSKDIFYFGYPYEIERKSNGEWKKVPPKEEQFFIMIAIYLKPDEVWRQEITLDGLEDGTYRVVKEVHNETRDSKYNIYAEFLVKNTVVK